MPTTQKIRYSDCDPQGIVFNGNYARYWDDALTDWFDDAGYGGPDLGGHDVDVVAARLEIDFEAPAGLGDMLETSIAVEKLGKTSMTLGFTTTRGDGTVVVSGREIVVFVDPSDLSPTPIPDAIRAQLAGESA